MIQILESQKATFNSFLVGLMLSPTRLLPGVLERCGTIRHAL